MRTRALELRPFVTGVLLCSNVLGSLSDRSLLRFVHKHTDGRVQYIRFYLNGVLYPLPRDLAVATARALLELRASPVYEEPR